MMQQQEEYRTELVANLTGCWQPSVMDCIRNLNRSKRPLFTEANAAARHSAQRVDSFSVHRFTASNEAALPTGSRSSA
jgi:hypothetical protein